MLRERTFTADFYALGQPVKHHNALYSFFAEEKSGKFSLLAGAESRLLTLVPCIAVCRAKDDTTSYYGIMEGLVMFHHNHLRVITTTLVEAESVEALAPAYQSQLNAFIANIQSRKLSDQQLDQAMMQRLMQLRMEQIV